MLQTAGSLGPHKKSRRVLQVHVKCPQWGFSTTQIISLTPLQCDIKVKIRNSELPNKGSSIPSDTFATLPLASNADFMQLYSNHHSGELILGVNELIEFEVNK